MLLGWEPLAHACNPSYSRGRDQENHGSKPAWTNSSLRPYLEKPIKKKKKRLVE
jgi:cytochrome c2